MKSNLKVLIVDDNEEFGQMLKDLLSQAGVSAKYVPSEDSAGSVTEDFPEVEAPPEYLGVFRKTEPAKLLDYVQERAAKACSD